MRAVRSVEPLTKRRPSGSSARDRTKLVWCVKLRRTVPLSELAPALELCGPRLRVPFGGLGVLLCHEPVVPPRALEVERVFREAVVDVLPPHERATHGDERRQRPERERLENAVGERRRIR